MGRRVGWVASACAPQVAKTDTPASRHRLLAPPRFRVIVSGSAQGSSHCAGEVV